MIELPDIIKELSPSKIGMFWRCAFQFQLRYIEGIKIPPASVMAWGSSTHKSLEHNYREKIKSRMDVPVDTLTDVFVDTWRTYRGEMQLGKDENFDTLENEGIAMMRAYHGEVAPRIMPRLVEEKALVKLTDEIDMSVIIDLVTIDEIIKDHKTSKKSPNKGVLERDAQVSAYFWAYKQAAGKDAAGGEWDYLVRTKTPKFVSVPVKRTPRQLERFRNVFEATAKQIAACYHAGTFPPRDSADNWMCNFNSCGYFRLCHARF